MLADLVLGAATLRVEGDPMVERLARSRDAVDQHDRRIELESLRTAVTDDHAAAEELITEYQSELTRSDEQVYVLEQDLEHERELRVRFEQALPHARDRGRRRRDRGERHRRPEPG